MKKTKPLSLIILGFLLFLPFVKISPAQGSYVGIQDGDEYLWKLSVYTANFGKYFDHNIDETLANLWPLEPIYTMTKVYIDWVYLREPLPQSHWPFDVIALGTEETGSLLFPFDNTIITYTPVMATAGWHLSRHPENNYYYNGTWYIVNDTSSFLRQTFNLLLAFSPYGIMSVPFAPKTINWTSFITKFLGVMNFRGGLYRNISATAKSNGYSLDVPALGFENNTVPIHISVTYNSNGVLKYYEFSSGGKILVKYTLYEKSVISQVVITIFVITFVSTVLMVVGLTIGLINSKKKKKSREILEGIKKKD